MWLKIIGLLSIVLACAKILFSIIKFILKWTLFLPFLFAKKMRRKIIKNEYDF